MLEVSICSLESILQQDFVKTYYLGPFFCWRSSHINICIFSGACAGLYRFLPEDRGLYAWFPVLLDLNKERKLDESLTIQDVDFSLSTPAFSMAPLPHLVLYI